MFKPKEILEIEEKIKQINEAEVEAREEIEKEEEEIQDLVDASGDLDKLTDIMAEEIIEEEMEKLDEITDLAAIEMVAEEAMDELLEIEIDESENEIIEGSGLSDIDFGSITEVTH